MDINLKPSKGLKFTLNADGVSYSVTGIGNCTDTNIVIPATYEGKPVTGIGEWAFYKCTSLTSINIPESVTSIGNYAFHLCTSLASVTIPESVTSIGPSAFWSCKSLQSIHIPESVTSIGDAAFCHCSSLKSITIPNSVANIDNNTFYDCDSLTDIYYNGTPEQFYKIAMCAGISQNTNIHFPDEKCCTMGELMQHFDIGEEIR